MVVGLIAAGVVVRLAFEVIPNFAPVAAIALFAGFAIRNRMLAAAAPLGVMLLSDAIIGGYHLAVMATVYASLALPVLAGHWLRSFRAGTPRTVAALMGSSLAASVLFFATTNFACWCVYRNVYGPTLAGLLECYASAIPFFRYTLAGDALFALTLFGGYFALQGIWQGVSDAKTPVPGDLNVPVSSR